MIFTVLVIIGIAWDDSIYQDKDYFDQCYNFCSVPLKPRAGAYLLVKYLVLIFPSFCMWIIFYIIPHKYNLNMSRNKDEYKIDLVATQDLAI